MAGRERIDEILSLTRPLDAPRRGRLPLLVWSLTDLTGPRASDLPKTLRALDERGLALISTWNHASAKGDPGSVAASLDIGLAQRDLGLEVCVNANALLHRFCDGSEATAHVDEAGHPFFDLSFEPSVPMGCPFALAHREPEIRSRVTAFADAYLGAGLRPTLVFADWEIDGPIEWNGAWDASRKCRRCRAAIPEIDDFRSFQRAVREVRSRLQRVSYAEPLRERFPEILVGNYGVYPHGGLRTWYDYFEELPAGAPTVADERARHRPWAHEFPLTGYTAAMPVLYPWSRIWGWYDREPPDFRWTYAFLAEASIAGRHTPPSIPLIPFVHWQPVAERGTLPAGIVPLSEPAYREILWHVLLRGASTLFLWCAEADTAKEIRPVHQVYRESLSYADLLSSGRPVCFDVPGVAGAVVSAVRAGSRLLARRTDFATPALPVEIALGGEPPLRVPIPAAPGSCTLVRLASQA